MKRKTKRLSRTGRKGKKSPSLAIVPAIPELRLGSYPVSDEAALIARAQSLADTLARILPEKGFVKVYEGKNPGVETKKYVKADGWTFAGQLLGVVPIEESCERMEAINGYKAVVRLERVHDGKTVGRASAVCSLNEPSPPDFSTEEFATYSKAITRATGKAFRLTYGWLAKLAGFEMAAAEELYEVEGTQEASEEVAKRKIEEKLGRKFPSLAEAEAAMLQHTTLQKEERATARRSVFISWPEAHHGHRFALSGKLLIWENGLTRDVEVVCAGVWNDRDGVWYVPAEHAVYLRTKIQQKALPLIEDNTARFDPPLAPKGQPEGNNAA